MSCPLGHPYLVKYEMSNPTATLLLCERRKGWRARTKRPLATLTARSGCGTVLVMSAIKLAPLSDRLDDEEMKSLGRLLEQAGAKLPAQDDHTTHTFAKRLSEEAMTEFLDRLDAHDVAADIYLPLEFAAAGQWPAPQHGQTKHGGVEGN